MPVNSGSPGSSKKCPAATAAGARTIAARMNPERMRPLSASAQVIGAKTTAPRSAMERKPKSFSVLLGMTIDSTAATISTTAIVKRVASSSPAGVHKRGQKRL